MNENAKMPTVTFGKAVIAIVALVIVLMLGFVFLGLDTKTTFLIASAVIGTLLVGYGFKLQQVIGWYSDGCRGAIDVILILMSVGCVIGTWIASGVVPTIMYYGLTFLNPTSFLIVGFLLCCIVSFFIGSSYSTLATLGVAFVGIGTGMGMNLGLVAGMCLSGALFGDKMSPFSDTTNMAPAVSGTTVYKHIGSMMYTVIPSFIITLVAYIVMGLRVDTSAAEMGFVDEMLAGITNSFNISPILLLVPVFMLVLAVKQIHPIVAMLGSSLLAIILGAVLQGDLMTQINALGVGFSIDTGVADLNRLVNRGGIAAMMETVAWTLLTLGMGNCLKESGILNAFLTKLLAFVKKPSQLVITTLLFSLATACLTAAQYLAIMLPGMLMKDQYTKFKLDKKVLSRTLEDGGTMFSFLIPWDTAGIYASSVLGVATLAYAPYAVLLWVNPIIAAVYAIVGFAQFKDESAEEAAA